MKKRIAIIFGTRPEAIKCAPVIQELGKQKDLVNPLIIVTAQHREMLDQVLDIFSIKPHIDLDIMQENQSLGELTGNVIRAIDKTLKDCKPDFILVQGDTTTTFISALAAFYNKIPVGHIEAGLRTFDKHHPFPEEINRQLASVVADLHFAPTQRAVDNLISLGIERERIFLTGNTVVDALIYMKNHMENVKPPVDLNNGMKLILLTAHRRENFGEPIKNICKAIKNLVELRDDIEVIYPVHLNPNIKGPVFEQLSRVKRVHLIPVQSYPSFVKLMSKAYIILSDSGGVQEEAPSLGKPVLVLRETSERMEAVEAGAVKIVGTSSENIINETLRLLDDSNQYSNMAHKRNPFGDGKASERIVSGLLYYFGFGERPGNFSLS
jgi:UDP-N-acetylglucosamine 2-epimerase (non-hydrolysing)